MQRVIIYAATPDVFDGIFLEVQELLVPGKPKHGYLTVDEKWLPTVEACRVYAASIGITNVEVR